MIDRKPFTDLHKVCVALIKDDSSLEDVCYVSKVLRWIDKNIRPLLDDRLIADVAPGDTVEGISIRNGRKWCKWKIPEYEAMEFMQKRLAENGLMDDAIFTRKLKSPDAIISDYGSDKAEELFGISTMLERGEHKPQIFLEKKEK